MQRDQRHRLSANQKARPTPPLTHTHKAGAKVLWQECIWKPSGEIRGSTGWGKQVGTSRVTSEQSKVPRGWEEEPGFVFQAQEAPFVERAVGDDI